MHQRLIYRYPVKPGRETGTALEAADILAHRQKGFLDAVGCGGIITQQSSRRGKRPARMLAHELFEGIIIASAQPLQQSRIIQVARHAPSTGDRRRGGFTLRLDILPGRRVVQNYYSVSFGAKT